MPSEWVKAAMPVIVLSRVFCATPCISRVIHAVRALWSGMGRLSSGTRQTWWTPLDSSPVRSRDAMHRAKRSIIWHQGFEPALRSLSIWDAVDWCSKTGVMTSASPPLSAPFFWYQPMNPGSIVRCRNRDWVLLPSEKPDVYLLRPLTGATDEVVAVHVGMSNLISRHYPRSGSARRPFLRRQWTTWPTPPALTFCGRLRD